MNINAIPRELKKIIASEETDFIVKSKRRYPKGQGIVLLIFTLIWNSMFSPFIIRFIKTQIEIINAGLLDFSFLTFQSLTIAIFFLLGLGLFVYSFVLIFQKGGYFVGTKSRLICYQNQTVTTKDWSAFTNNIKVSGKGVLGNLEIELKKEEDLTGRRKRKISEVIYIIGIKNVNDIEKKIRNRIQEHQV